VLARLEKKEGKKKEKEEKKKKEKSYLYEFNKIL
jgi:hypothetical protein